MVVVLLRRHRPEPGRPPHLDPKLGYARRVRRLGGDLLRPPEELNHVPLVALAGRDLRAEPGPLTTPEPFRPGPERNRLLLRLRWRSAQGHIENGGGRTVRGHHQVARRGRARTAPGPPRERRAG